MDGELAQHRKQHVGLCTIAEDTESKMRNCPIVGGGGDLFTVKSFECGRSAESVLTGSEREMKKKNAAIDKPAIVICLLKTSERFAKNERKCQKRAIWENEPKQTASTCKKAGMIATRHLVEMQSVDCSRVPHSDSFQVECAHRIRCKRQHDQTETMSKQTA